LTLSPKQDENRATSESTINKGRIVNACGRRCDIFLSQAQRKMTVRAVTLMFWPSFYLVARPDIRTVKELKGKTIGVGFLGTTNHVVTQKVLSNFGLGTDDVTIMAVGDFPFAYGGAEVGNDSGNHGRASGSGPGERVGI
jgi:hypothetical protein